MVTLHWYNLVAIIVGLLFFSIGGIILSGDDRPFDMIAIRTVRFCRCIWLFLLFYAIWGGIFWW